MNAHQAVNTATAFLMGAILMALGFSLFTRTSGGGGSSTSTNAVPPTTVVVSAPAPSGLTVDEARRIAREEAQRQQREEGERFVRDMCADPNTIYAQRQILGCDERR